MAKNKTSGNSDESKLDRSAGFFTNLLGFMAPIGTFDDPDNKAGLLDLSLELYKYGTKNYPDSLDLYYAVENLSSILFSYGSRDSMGIGLRFPSNLKASAGGNDLSAKNIDVQEFLKEIVNEVQFDKEQFKKAQKTQIMKINELRSDDRAYAIEQLAKLVMGGQETTGTLETIQNIEIDDVRNLHKEFSKSASLLNVKGPEDWNTDKSASVHAKEISDLEMEKTKKNDNQKDVADRLMFIDRELSQKVVSIGFPTKGILNYDYFTVSVGRRILYNGLVGLIPEIIREKHSAAYYAYSSTSIYRTKGMFYIVAGVSEENVVKTIELSGKVLEDVSKGNFDDGYLIRAKEKTKAVLEQILDDPGNIFDFYSDLIIRGRDIEAHDEWIDAIDRVQKSQVVEFFDEIANMDDAYIVVNGNLKDETKKNCEEFLK